MRRATFAFTVACCLLALPRPAFAELTFTPFVGATARTTSGFLDLDGVAQDVHAVFGLATTYSRWKRVAIEFDGAFIPSQFAGGDLIPSSRTMTLSGSLLLTLPHPKWTGRVEPYATVGLGVFRTNYSDRLDVFRIDSALPIAVVGGGASIPVTPHLSVRVDVRYLHSRGDIGVFGDEFFHAWRPTVGVTWSPRGRQP